MLMDPALYETSQQIQKHRVYPRSKLTSWEDKLDWLDKFVAMTLGYLTVHFPDTSDNIMNQTFILKYILG